jgi:hypothetical protein
LIIRSIAWLLTIVILLGLAFAVWLVIQSRRPEPGANMALMGLPMVMLPMSLAAIIVLGLTFTAGTSLTLPERVVLRTISLMVLPLAIIFMALG